MTVPDWRASKAGARSRVALWLHTEVGPDGTFTKAQLRDAFPGVEQIDRRMRDLRAEGWVITTYREDRSLSADELRLRTVGAAVWERGYQSRAATAVTDKERQAVFAADGYACVYCGISGGESYSDDTLRTAKLTVARLPPAEGGPPQLLTACDRCHVAVRDEEPLHAGDVLAKIDTLDAQQRQRFLDWVLRGTRTPRPEDLLWALYRRLPRAERDAVLEHLRSPDQAPSRGGGS